MLLPLIGFIMGSVVFSGMGLIVLSRGIPALRLTLTNLLLFVSGHFWERLPWCFCMDGSLQMLQVSSTVPSPSLD